MTWQLLIWNIFVWSFTGAMITLNNASMWWLVLPALFTVTQNASQIMKQYNEKNEDEFDEETTAKMRILLEKAKRGQL